MQKSFKQITSKPKPIELNGLFTLTKWDLSQNAKVVQQAGIN